MEDLEPGADATPGTPPAPMEETVLLAVRCAARPSLDCTLEVPLASAVATVKRQLAQRSGVSERHMRLIFSGRVLADTEVLRIVLPPDLGREATLLLALHSEYLDSLEAAAPPPTPAPAPPLAPSPTPTIPAGGVRLETQSTLYQAVRINDELVYIQVSTPAPPATVLHLDERYCARLCGPDGQEGLALAPEAVFQLSLAGIHVGTPGPGGLADAGALTTDQLWQHARRRLATLELRRVWAGARIAAMGAALFVSTAELREASGLGWLRYFLINAVLLVSFLHLCGLFTLEQVQRALWDVWPVRPITDWLQRNNPMLARPAASRAEAAPEAAPDDASDAADSEPGQVPLSHVHVADEPWYRTVYRKCIVFTVAFVYSLLPFTQVRVGEQPGDNRAG